MFEDEIWNEIKHMRNKMNRFFGMSDFPSAAEEHSRYRHAWTDFDENEKEYYLNVEIPGVNKQDIQIHIANQTLVVKAEKKQQFKKKEEDENKEIKHYHSVKKYVGFYRSFDLPLNADIEKISAEYIDGVLRVRIQKKAAQKKTVAVK